MNCCRMSCHVLCQASKSCLWLILLLVVGGCQHSTSRAVWSDMTHFLTGWQNPSQNTNYTSSELTDLEHQAQAPQPEEVSIEEGAAQSDVVAPESKAATSEEPSLDPVVIGQLDQGTDTSTLEDVEERVMVKNGFVCVSEKSATAEVLADILSSGLSEDLSEAVQDEHASEIDPIVPADHPDVKKWLKYFLNNRSLFQRYLNRGANYKLLVSQVLKEEGLPPELFYLALVESGFRPAARSSASAVGIWQFIRATGKRYGLKVNYYIDERKDPVRATRAAARYLASLYRVYQSWELAAAAYNAGENRVLSAIMRGHTRDFWELSHRKLLPRETRDYVPKMMAAIQIGQNLDQYGFTFKALNNYGIPIAAKVPGGVRIRDVAAVIGVSQQSLIVLNPHIRKGIAPPGGTYKLWVSNQMASDKIASSYKTLASQRERSRVVSRGSVSKGYHLVRRGQTLDSIGRRYKLSVRELKQLNGIRGSLIYVGQKLKVSKSTAVSSRPSTYYVIKKGDTLYSIAKKYRTSVRDLQRKNRIKGSRVLIGQKIRI
ncbi:MAG: transglycosylase SLT domain-containing protein [Proteobacteria bacterium]|nr:transglycosylase SLT domain-containing protein [Pseudomonadota bacterium]